MTAISKIKLIHLLSRFDTGGLENGIVNICNGLDRERFEPVVCCVRGAGPMAERLQSDVKLVNMHLHDGNYWTILLEIIKLFRKEKPYVVHTHGWGQGAIYGIIGGRIAGVPVIINGEHGAFFLKPHQIFAQRILSRFCDITLSVSESLKKNIHRNLGIMLDGIMTIPNGVKTDVFNGLYDTGAFRKELLEKYGCAVNTGDFLIASIASLKPAKNQIMLLQSIRSINKRNPGNCIKVLFAGIGPDYRMLEDYATNNLFPGQAVFLGARDDMARLLSLVDVLILTSISEHEGMSNAILEAMSSARPVISTVSVGSSEIVKNGLNGFLINVADKDALSEKIELLAGDLELRTKMGQSARESILQRYSMNKMVSAYSTLYFDLCKKVDRNISV
jgi:glycosyltransferase involved in cell wall biosynthesis